MAELRANNSNGKRVLVVSGANLETAGLELYLYDRLPILAKVYGADITLLVPGVVKSHSMESVFVEAGIRIVEGHANVLSPRSKIIPIQRTIKELCKEKQFDVLHVNSGGRRVIYSALSAAKQCGIPVRVAHSHNVLIRNSLRKLGSEFYRWRIGADATHLLACSHEAGINTFGKREWERRGIVVKNGINIGEYAFSNQLRSAVRSQYGVNSQTRVIGFVGRLEDQKNPLFVAQLAVELCRKDVHLVFWVVGDGSMRTAMEKIVWSSGFGERILFFGPRDDVPKLMQGMDAFVLPSKNEGLGMVLVEAQASGLPCFASDKVPEEAHIPGCPLEFFSLNDDASVWAGHILSSDFTRNERGADMVRSAKYDLESSLEVLVSLYSKDINY